ncbi:MAG: cupredoxin domain-containing protein [Ginsengibacter sp.]
MKHNLLKLILLYGVAMLVGTTIITGCNGIKGAPKVTQSDTGQAALETYVPPGKLDGKYLVSLNKTGKDGQHLNVGPMQSKSLQLIDISGPKMKLLYDAFTDPETHFAQIIPANKLNPIEVYPKAENKNPKAIWDPKEAKIVSNGKNVEVYMTAVMSNFAPNTIEMNKGDKVTMYITNIQQEQDESHGFAIDEYNMNVVIEPGETKTVEFTANKQGVFPFYCTVFCSPLYEEMQGNLLVKGSNSAMSVK